MIDLVRYQPILMADDKDRFLDGVEMFGGEHVIDTKRVVLAYWFAWPGDRDHAGIDWEHADVHLLNGQPDTVALAQHRGGQRLAWHELEREGDRSVLYAGRDKHSTRPHAGWFLHGLHVERANGRVRLELPLRFDVPVAVQHRRAWRDPLGWAASL